MYDLLLQRKISVVRTFDGKDIKAMDCIIKVAITRGNNVTFLCIKGLCIQQQKAHDNLCFPLRRAYPLLLCIYFYARVKVFFPIPFFLFFLFASIVWRGKI